MPRQSLISLLLVFPLLGGCALFGINANNDEARAKHEKMMADLKAQSDKAIADAERQQKIAEARRVYLEKELSAQEYKAACATLVGDVEKVVIKMGRSVQEKKGELIVTDWSYVQPRYDSTWDYRILQTRVASKNRYVLELESSSATACKVRATYQYVDENGGELTDRALDFETRFLEQVDPTRYAEVEAQSKAIEAQYPAGA